MGLEVERIVESTPKPISSKMEAERGGGGGGLPCALPSYITWMEVELPSSEMVIVLSPLDGRRGEPVDGGADEFSPDRLSHRDEGERGMNEEILNHYNEAFFNFKTRSDFKKDKMR